MKTRILIAMLATLLLTPLAWAQAGASDPHIAKALELRDKAVAAYGTGDYDGSAELARRAKAELSLARSATPLPAAYKVRLLPEDRDCLYKIASYPFVYGDGARWPLLYKANKATLRHPENADLLLPGELLVIPSLAGEPRSGAWDPKTAYPGLD
jgi:hypothetical protein